MPTDDKTALVGVGDREFEYALLADSFFCFAPDECLTSFLERNFDITFFATDVDNLTSDDVSDVDLLDDVASILKLSTIDNTGAESRQVDVDCTFVYRYNGSFDQIVYRRGNWNSFN